MSDQYDVIMIGAGPSAIFCAYELKRNKPDMKVLMIEKGRRIERRACPCLLYTSPSPRDW